MSLNSWHIAKTECLVVFLVITLHGDVFLRRLASGCEATTILPLDGKARRTWFTIWKKSGAISFKC